jgi:glycosyltransferase involved in cell wall biosynthesis
VLSKTGPYLSGLGVPLYDLNASRVRYAIPAFVRLVRRLRPMVVLSNIGELNLMLLFSRPLLPRGVRLWVRETQMVSDWLKHEAARPGVLAAFYRHLYPRADGIICPSDAILRDLAENFGTPRIKLTRIYNPIDVERIRNLGRDGPNPHVRPASLPHPTPQEHLLACGRLTRVKGFDLLLEAMARVVRARPGTELTILGEGPLDAELKAQAGQLDLGSRVRFPGFQANPYPWIKYADLLVIPSRADGLPNVMLEALALGTPVLGTDCPGGMREILEDCPIGRVAPNGDVRALADAIIETLAFKAAKRVQMPEELESFLDRFRLERIIRQYEDTLSGVAAPG